MINIEHKLQYPMALILSTNNKKTAEALSKVTGKSGDTTLRILEQKCATWEELITVAIAYFGTDKLYVIFDDSLIEKMFSKFIEASGDNYDSSTGQTYRSLCTVVGMLSDGKNAIPVIHDLWIKKEVSPEGQHKTKVAIAQELILKIKEKIQIKMVIMDGLYATYDMIKWCNANKILFEMRLHSNRKIVVDFDNPDETVKVNECEQLRLKGKRTCRTVKAMWHGEPIYVTAVKRFRKNDSTIVYQVSNANLSARDHARVYGYRWNIERFFRTAKQHLGLTHCQSRKQILQKNHIYNVFLAYTILQFERKKYKLKNPEAALHRIKRKRHTSFAMHLARADQIFRNVKVAHA